MRRIAIALVLSTGCVFPSDSPTGIEFSWLFREHDGSDGEDAKRVLTCAAPGVETIAATIEDLDAPARRGTFRFPCEDGFQTSDELARRASEAFLELDPGEYDVVLVAEDPRAHNEVLATRTVDVLSRAVTLELWELALEPVTWTVEIANATSCTELSLGLYYADPQAALGDVPVDDEGDPLPVLYREMLLSDRGLGIGDVAATCAEHGGEHVFTGVDRGVYRLEVETDGTRCAIEVELVAPAPGGRGPSTTIDVAVLPCGS